MKFLLVLASLSGVNAFIAVEEAMHTDKWCADHHLGEGPSTCIQHSGCCYDGRIGVCHSCDVHSNEWCSTYGGSAATECVQYSGCTFTVDGCVSAKPELAATIKDELTCTERLADCEAGDECEFEPSCDVDGNYELVQSASVEGDQFSFCVDEAGHEIPDTRKKTQAFLDTRVNCEKERKKHGGEQCPNAVTLTTGNGQVLINDHEDVGNCDISCNTDLDCKANQWCCYNGCGYSCQKPIKPQEDCEHLGGLIADFPGVEVYGLKEEDVGSNGGQTGRHGAEATLRCQDGWNALKDDDGLRTNQVTITCRHGNWEDESEWDITCKKDCSEYSINGSETDAAGDGIWHGHHNYGENDWVATEAEARMKFIKDDRATFDAGDVNEDGLLDFDEFGNMNGFDGLSVAERRQSFDSLDQVSAETGEPDGVLDFEEFDAEYFTYHDRPHRGGAFHNTHSPNGDVDRVPIDPEDLRLENGYNMANRSRDYVIKGNGVEHGAKRRVSCADGYGAVSGTADVLAHGREKVRCVNGAWEPQQTLECSTCFDARADAWKDADGNDCVYFASRPMECAENEGAKANCRIACRTCDDAADKYKIKAVQNNVMGVKHRSSWKYMKMKVKVGHQKEQTDSRQVKVAKLYSK